MNPIRVFIVDDSAVARGLITSALADVREVVIAGSAANGAIALNKLPQVNPDVVVMDVEMPELDGLATLDRLRKTHPRLPVIMFSGSSEQDARLTMLALERGANDYVVKPSNPGGSLQEATRRLLVPKIVALCRPTATLQGSRWSEPPKTGAHKLPTGVSRTNLAPVVAPPANELRTRLVPQIVAMASSTGGPNALIEVIAALPRDFPVPVVIVQHMPPIFTRLLAERLASVSQLRVAESQGGERLSPGLVYLAPGNRHLELARVDNEIRTVLSDAAPENSCRPSADVLFRSVAQLYGANTLAVVLTGMGSDGLNGAREVFQAGGRVIAQSGPTCVVWGMPKAVESAGLCEAVVPLTQMAEAIRQRVVGGPGTRRSTPAGG